MGLATTVKQPVHVPVPPSGLVTVMSRAPVGAFWARVPLTVSVVPFTKVTEFTVKPVPESEPVAPLAKLVPVRVVLPGPLP